MEALSLPDLVKIKKSCSDAADRVFKSKFAWQTFKILSPMKTIDEPFIFYFDGNRIEINALHVFRDILQAFGHLISNLEVDLDNINENDRFEIGRQTVRWCSKALPQLNLQNCDLSVFTENQSSLQNVENVTFSGDVKYSQSGILNLNQFLPKMQSLSFDSISVCDSNLFDNEFSNLKRLFVKFVSWTPNEFKEMLTEKLFKNNQQIEYVHLVNSDIKFLKAVKVSSNPKVLKIQRLIQNDQSADNEENFHDDKVLFDGLNEVELDFVEDFELNEFIEFIDNSLANVTKLQLKQGVVNAQQLIKLASASPNLIEASLDCGVDALPNNITTFMDFSGKLNKLYLKASNETTHNTLREQLTDKWIVTEIMTNENLSGISFERR